MKKIIAIMLILFLFLPAAASADVDLTGMTFDELVYLREQINLAIWNSQEWQEVKVPTGMYQIGKDIPSGHWMITPEPNVYANLWYGDIINESGSDAGYGWDNINGFNKVLSTKTNKDGTWADPDKYHYVDLILKEGWYIKLSADMVFSPYTGKPDLGFK